MKQLWVVKSMRTSQVFPPSPQSAQCLMWDTGLPSTSVKRSSFYSHLSDERKYEARERLVTWSRSKAKADSVAQARARVGGISCPEFKQRCTTSPSPSQPYQKDSLVIPPPVRVRSGLRSVCAQQLHYQVARASSRWANALPEWELAGLTSQAKEGICICLTAPIIQICPQLEKWRPGQRPASDLQALLSPRSVPSCCLRGGQAGPPWTPCTVILQSPRTLWLLCQQLDARPGSAGLWSLEPAGLQARELPDVRANKWQELLCNYRGTEISREIISPTGFGIQSNRGHKLLFVCEVGLVTSGFHSGVCFSWNEAFLSSLKGEGLKSRWSSIWYRMYGYHSGAG